MSEPRQRTALDDSITRLASARAVFRLALADATAGENGSAVLFQEAAEELFSAADGFAVWCSSVSVEEFAARRFEIGAALAFERLTGEAIAPADGSER